MNTDRTQRSEKSGEYIIQMAPGVEGRRRKGRRGEHPLPQGEGEGLRSHPALRQGRVGAGLWSTRELNPHAVTAKAPASNLPPPHAHRSTVNSPRRIA